MRSSEHNWIVLPLLALFLSTSAANAASSGTLLLSGVVPLVNDIAITANGSNNSTLNISGGETAKLVASVSETSNNSSGYTVTLSSANAGQLKLASDATKKTAYQISYNGGSYVSPAVSPATVKTVSSLGTLTTNSSPVRVNVTAFANAPAGTYSDTITLAIVANP
ncbi:MAG: hypothetical protein AB7K68_02705 [Bacteriovoracia bacterium]